MKPSVIVLIALGWVGTSSAELHWRKALIQQTAAPADEEAVAEYAFTNAGPDTVTIQSVHSSCGCTTAALDKKVYQPGETGKITVTFTFGDRVGEQLNYVTLRTDNPQNPLYTLTMSVNIPQLLKIEPKNVSWKHDEPRTAKTMHLSVAAGVPLRVLEVKVNAPGFAVDLQPVQGPAAAPPAPSEPSTNAGNLPGSQPPCEYEVKVTPPPQGAAGTPGPIARLSIVTDFPADKPRTFAAFATAENPPKVVNHVTFRADQQPPEKPVWDKRK